MQVYSRVALIQVVAFNQSFTRVGKPEYVKEKASKHSRDQLRECTRMKCHIRFNLTPGERQNQPLH